MDLKEFFEMGGYAGYVWTSYGLTALILLWNWWAARRSEAEAQTAARRRNELALERSS
ncbi:MAG: heme exporter protein CcmD [Proteobacteria bacterium]|nr:heme exporter protein CcmD [Pseudomonadota bacterium]